MTLRVRCDCCKRRRSLDFLVPLSVSRDIHSSGLLVVCSDRAGCRNLDMPVAAAVGVDSETGDEMRFGRNARITEARIQGSIHRTEQRDDGFYCACGVKLCGLGLYEPLHIAFLDHLTIVHNPVNGETGGDE